MKIYDLLIIGAGPAGLGAVIQAAHLGLAHLLIEREEPQSRLLLARKVENFPLAGEGGLSGPELYCSLVAQARNSGVNIITGPVSSVKNDKGIFIIAAKHNTYKSKAVILSTGLLPKKLSRIVAPQELEDKKLFYRWTDIPRGRRKGGILVIGGGEVAFDQACSLAEKGFEITLAVRGSNDRVFDSLRREAKESGVSVKYNTFIEKITEDGNGISAFLRNGERKILRRYDYCLAAIGSTRNVPVLSSSARQCLNAGIYLAGDLAHPQQKQAAIAFGDGIKKTTMAYNFIRENKE
ncbi:MAG: NAD(P)/FAD-dependent oxidoreductase [Candidatus Edwardsbacteria bacterium]|nr:NAD(P)/FAD-dependent oxidoreductase [Candidatus Edwardsbacteria bacterium]